MGNITLNIGRYTLYDITLIIAINIYKNKIYFIVIEIAILQIYYKNANYIGKSIGRTVNRVRV